MTKILLPYPLDMKSWKDKLKKFLTSEWSMAGMLLAIFFITHGYRFGWDDQHLELPLLKSLIDQDLYPHDYYVQSLKKNFTSCLYPLLAKLIRVEQIEAAYLVLFIAARYFLFFFIYKFWRQLTDKSWLAFFCSVTIIVLTRVQGFLYWTFSHNEFALPFIFAGLYYFYKERFLLSAAILGISSNFHALYSFFPFAYMSVFLLISFKRYGLKMLFKTTTAYFVFASPFIIWTLQKSMAAGLHLDSPELDQWLALYRKNAPEFFLFGARDIKILFSNFERILAVTNKELYFICLYLFNCFHGKSFRSDFKNHCMVLTSFLLLAIYFIAGYIFPNKFILLLSLYRTREYLFFFLPAFTVLTCFDVIKRQRPWIGLLMGIMLFMMTDKNLVVGLFAIAMTCILSLNNFSLKNNTPLKAFKLIVSMVCLIFTLWMFYSYMSFVQIDFLNTPLIRNLIIVLLALTAIIHSNILKSKKPLLMNCFIIIPFIFSTTWYTQARYKKATTEKIGIELVQEAWKDMQLYVQANTPKSAVILAPYDMQMGGFRIFSERSIVVCNRDAGIILFDMEALLEMEKRLKDIENFTTMPTSSLESAVINAISKYDADYIVFSTYSAPVSNYLLQRIYYNSGFVLYKVNRNI